VAALRAARAWGVSPQRFLGWEPETVTVVERDSAGRVVRTISRAEPEWGDEDRDLAVALLDFEAGLCSSCRTPLVETTDAQHEDAYRADPAIRCHRCTAIIRGSEMYRDAPQPGALLIPVHLREREAHASDLDTA